MFERERDNENNPLSRMEQELLVLHIGVTLDGCIGVLGKGWQCPCVVASMVLTIASIKRMVVVTVEPIP